MTAKVLLRWILRIFLIAMPMVQQVMSVVMDFSVIAVLMTHKQTSDLGTACSFQVPLETACTLNGLGLSLRDFVLLEALLACTAVRNVSRKSLQGNWKPLAFSASEREVLCKMLILSLNACTCRSGL